MLFYVKFVKNFSMYLNNVDFTLVSLDGKRIKINFSLGNFSVVVYIVVLDLIITCDMLLGCLLQLAVF